MMAKAKETPQRGIAENPDLKMYTVAEISPLVGISEITLKRYIRAHRLKASFIAGKWRVSAANLKAFLDKGLQRKQPDVRKKEPELESVPEKSDG